METYVCTKFSAESANMVSFEPLFVHITQDEFIQLSGHTFVVLDFIDLVFAPNFVSSHRFNSLTFLPFFSLNFILRSIIFTGTNAGLQWFGI